MLIVSLVAAYIGTCTADIPHNLRLTTNVFYYLTFFFFLIIVHIAMLFVRRSPLSALCNGHVITQGADEDSHCTLQPFFSLFKLEETLDYGFNMYVITCSIL